ncbi:MAG: hypothetical protein LQ338_001408 [Usnochroma carphineum]|nr:MAG: hypothetical protein LQ338_001408 [Usnochroma carphineum]
MADRLLHISQPPRQKASHGRGGAGNIGPTVNSATNPQNLTTPTIKSQTYTTGRGGSGNMKKNDPRHPEVARKSQDVEPPPSAVVGKRRGSAGHIGRGGAANVLRPNIDEFVRGRDESAVVDEGSEYEKVREEDGERKGDWWRDEMASGRN